MAVYKDEAKGTWRVDHRIMEVRRFFYKRLVFSDNRCSNRFFLVSAGIFVG